MLINMAMLNSNTHLRVPRGFGAILEGLTREILRDQPKDIPKYAAEYFEALLKKREETGTDPSEWAAKLDHQYYNNYSFKTSDHASRTTVSNINSQVFVAEDYSGQSQEDVSMTTMKTNHFTKSEEEESSPILTQAESAKGPLVARTASTKADGLSNEINNSRASNNSESESHKVHLLSETVNIDAQESEGGSEEDQEHADQEDKPGNVNICAKDLEETTDTASVMEEDAEQKVAFESNEIRLQSPVSQLQITEQKQEQANNDAIGTTSDDIEESSNNKPLVEISFDNVPENQQSMNNEMRINVEIMEKTDTLTNEQKVQLEEETQDDDNEENTSNNDNSMQESIDIIDMVHQPITKADHLVGEDTDNINNDENSSLKDNFEKLEVDLEDTTTSVEETNEDETDYQEIAHHKSVDQDAASDSTQLTDSIVKILEQQGEILQKGEDDLLENNEEEQQEASLEKYFTVSKDQHSEDEEQEEKEPMEENMSDSEVKEGHPSGDQDNVNPDLEQWTDNEDIGLQKKQSDTPDPEGQTNEKQEECSRSQEEEDIMDIPLDDPEANRAAAKIQAGFRGHMTRKKMKPEDKTEGEEVSSSGDVLNGSQGSQRQEDRGQ